MKMSQPLRVDYPEGFASFVTRRTINSRLQLCNNRALENRLLGCLGKYVNKYEAKLYAFTLCGSHDHATIEFKPRSKIGFLRDFGARTAESIRTYVPQFEGGPVFERRASEQAVPTSDIVERYWYTVLQAVEHGLAKKISEYPAYNSFWDSISGRPLETRFVNYAKFRAAKKRNPMANIADFTEVNLIHFARLPGYEYLSQKEYQSVMLQELERRQSEIVQAKEAEGYRYPSPSSLKRVKPTDKAKNPKKSKRHDPRPLVLTRFLSTKKWFLNWYFAIVASYKAASKKYLEGDATVQFPPGTCKPPGPLAH